MGRRHISTRSRRSCACARGQADVWIDDEHVTLTNGQLVIVPAGRKHGFSNAGKAVLHIESTLAAPVFEAAYDDKRETPRRWLPGGGANTMKSRHGH